MFSQERLTCTNDGKMEETRGTRELDDYTSEWFTECFYSNDIWELFPTQFQPIREDSEISVKNEFNSENQIAIESNQKDSIQMAALPRRLQFSKIGTSKSVPNFIRTNTSTSNW